MEDTSIIYQEIYDLHQLVRERMISREPEDFTVQLSSTMHWNVNYKNRKHIFMWSGTQIILACEDYGSFTIPASTWTNLAMPEGMRITVPAASTPIYAQIRATDEVIP